MANRLRRHSPEHARFFPWLSRLSLPALLVLCAANHSALAQTIPAKGTDGTFDVATWNIEWFGGSGGPANDELQFRNVLEIIRAADIDLWALQEINDPTDFTRLLDSLGSGYAGNLATYGATQKIAFIYKTAVVHVLDVKQILDAFSYDFGTRPPLQLRASITANTNRDVTFITVHMKAEDGNPESYERRLAAAGRLKNHVDFTTLADEMVIVLGDFNDTLTGSISSSSNTSPYANFESDTQDYLFLTSDLERDGRSTYCGNNCNTGSTIDHILITNEFFGSYVVGSVDHFDELLTDVTNYLNTTSDHLPVFASFQLDTQTGTERPDPLASVSLSVFPNPSSGGVTVTIETTVRDQFVAQVFDVVGRRVWIGGVLTSSTDNRLAIPTDDWPSGTYFVVLHSDRETERARFVIN